MHFFFLLILWNIFTLDDSNLSSADNVCNENMLLGAFYMQSLQINWICLFSIKSLFSFRQFVINYVWHFRRNEYWWTKGNANTTEDWLLFESHRMFWNCAFVKELRFTIESTIKYALNFIQINTVHFNFERHSLNLDLFWRKRCIVYLETDNCFTIITTIMEL